MDQQLAEPYLLRPPGQSRFVLLDRPIAHPGICRVCGASQKPVVDFGSTDDDGVIYFCVDCLTEVAKGVLNLVDASELEVARLTATQALAQRDKAGKLVHGYIHSLGVMHDRLISDLRSLPYVDDSVSENISDESHGQGYDEIRDSISRESPVGEFVSVEGPVGLSNDSGDDPNGSSSVFSV